MTCIGEVDRALERARTESCDHWGSGTLDVELGTPGGESIEVTLDLEDDAVRNVQARYERAKELEAELERERRALTNWQRFRRTG